MVNYKQIPGKKGYYVDKRQCRYCKYYTTAPNTISWPLSGDVQYYSGYCKLKGPRGEIHHVNPGDTCIEFRRNVKTGPVLGAYNKGGQS